MHVKSLKLCVWEWRRYTIKYNSSALNGRDFCKQISPNLARQTWCVPKIGKFAENQQIFKSKPLMTFWTVLTPTSCTSFPCTSAIFEQNTAWVLCIPLTKATGDISLFSALLRSSAVTSVTCQLTIVLRMCLYPYGSVFNAVAKSVCNPVISPASMSCTTFCIVSFINLRSAECVCSYYGLRVC